jgi:plastocyanin
MSTLTARFALGVTLLAIVCAIADSAQAGPFRNRRGGGDCGCGSMGYGYGSGYGYGGGYSSGSMVGYGQSMYYPSGGYGYGSSMYPGTTVGYGQSMYYPGNYAYGRRMYYPSTAYGYGQPTYLGTPGVYQAGYAPGYNTGGLVPAGGVPGQMPNVAAEAKSVKITDTAFDPKELTVTPGTTVRWTNNDNHVHTVTSSKGDWDSGDIQVGRDFSATFTKPGTFEYYCKHHPDMKGTIVVK